MKREKQRNKQKKKKKENQEKHRKRKPREEIQNKYQHHGKKQDSVHRFLSGRVCLNDVSKNSARKPPELSQLIISCHVFCCETYSV